MKKKINKVKDTVCIHCRQVLDSAWYRENRIKAEKALKKAKRINAGSSFVKSCAKQFELKGYLSDKQIECLNNIEPKSTYYPDYSCDFLWD